MLLDQTFEALIMSNVDKRSGKAAVVLDYQKHAVAGVDLAAIVADDDLYPCFETGVVLAAERDQCRFLDPRVDFAFFDRDRHSHTLRGFVSLRYIESECAAFSRNAVER